jgi:peroxiredoxin Q/BCP
VFLTQKEISMAKKTVAKVSKKVAPPTSHLVGQKVPSFTLPSTGGRSVALKALQGKPVVLYFYPRDSTPGCTVEGHDFSKLYENFRKVGAEVFGVSRDSLKSHEKFKEVQKYKMDLLSDEEEAACKLFDVIKMKNMYGKKVRGIERSTFVIDRDGKLVKEWRGVKVAGHAEEVLAFVQSL